MKVGQVLKVIATAPAYVEDFLAFAYEINSLLLGVEKINNEFVYFLSVRCRN